MDELDLTKNMTEQNIPEVPSPISPPPPQLPQQSPPQLLPPPQLPQQSPPQLLPPPQLPHSMVSPSHTPEGPPPQPFSPHTPEGPPQQSPPPISLRPVQSPQSFSPHTPEGPPPPTTLEQGKQPEVEMFRTQADINVVPSDVDPNLIRPLSPASIEPPLPKINKMGLIAETIKDFTKEGPTGIYKTTDVFLKKFNSEKYNEYVEKLDTYFIEN